MADSKSTTLMEQERADRFGSARGFGFVMWTREQGKKVKEIQDEQQGEQPEEDTTIEDKFNSQ